MDQLKSQDNNWQCLDSVSGSVDDFNLGQSSVHSRHYPCDEDPALHLVSEVLGQFKAYGEKVYDQALKLRTLIGQNEESEKVCVAVAANLERLKERLGNWHEMIEQLGRPLRQKDQEILEELEVLCEKVESVIALEQFERSKDSGFHLPVEIPEMVKTRARNERIKKEKLERQRKAIEKLEAKAGDPDGSDSIIDQLIEDLRREESDEKLKADQRAKEQAAWAVLKLRIQVGVLLVALILMPLAYFSFGRLGQGDRISVNVWDYKKVIEMEKAYTQNRLFVAIVQPRWVKLTEDVKKGQVHNLAKKVKEITPKIDVRDTQGNLLAEHRRGKVTLYH